MPIRAGERPGLGGAAKLVADRARSIVRLELQLAATEIKKKVAALGIGIGLLVGSAIFGVFGLGFVFATAAAALATAMSTWLALLIVTGALFLLAGLFALIGLRLVKKGVPPVPEQALEEAKRTAEVLRDGH
jgi:hypothetical protein